MPLLTNKCVLPITAVLIHRGPLPLPLSLDGPRYTVIMRKSRGDIEFSLKEGESPIYLGEAYASRFFPTDPATEVRAKFMALQSPDQARLFFERYGAFEWTPDQVVRAEDLQRRSRQTQIVRGSGKAVLEVPETRVSITTGQDEAYTNGPFRALPVTWKQLRSAQDEFRAALLDDHAISSTGYRSIFGRPLKALLQLPEPMYYGQPVEELIPTGFVCCNDIVEAIRASIFLDKLRNSKWSCCERCGRPFEKTNKHARKYCPSPDGSPSRCAQADAIDRFRAKQKAPASERKKK